MELLAEVGGKAAGIVGGAVVERTVLGVGKGTGGTAAATASGADVAGRP